ncbi:G5 domain-containing protein [Ruoffia tabacinasalis]|uniref:G5 domain-containing protein n=1 Tax=Ruoffia tabacinasalis TaxID=87458 RepID=A0ABS0LGA8_9LACT|nr:G5 domain-containing protein [Ruoffia tabacinasalis]MBG9977213.1 G5 domain-containing protein [Ruoffia tabacinasalis]
MKLLRKVKGLWIAVALTGVVSTAALPVVTYAQVSDSQIAFVLSTELGSNFEGKSDLINDNIIKEEVKKALENASLIWQENTVEDIVEEVKRQEEAGLKAYVVQWGDTLSNIAEAVDKDVDKLIELNLIENPDLILTGDILDGVLNVESVTQSTSNNTPPSYVNNPVQEAEPSAPIPGDPNVDEPPAFEEAPEGETPDEDLESPVPETPDEPGIVEPDVPETPEEPGTDEPDVPEQPEEPGTDEPDVPEQPEEPGTDEPDVPEQPEVPETPEVPEQPETPGEEIPSEIPVETPEVPGNEAPTEEEVPAESEGIGEEVIEEEGESWQEEVPGEGGGLVNEETNTEEQLIPGDPTPGEDITQSTTTTKRFYVEPFKTIINYDGTVLSGDDIVEQEGINGEYVEITTVITEDGVVVNESTDTQVISNMVPRIIRRGTKTQQTVRTVQETYVINHGVDYVEDDGVPTGEEEVVQEGVNGQRVVTIEEVLDANGTIVSRTVISEDVTEAINKVIKVGTQVTEVRHYDIDESIDFTTDYVEDDTLPVGETEVVQTGQKGTAVRTFEVTYVNGDETNRVETGYVVTSNPVNEVIARGTQTTEVKQVTEDKTIEFDTEYRKNPNLPKGEEREVQAGVNGTERTTYNVTYVNGDEVDREVAGTEVVKAPVNRIVEVGSQVTETKTETKTESVEFKTVYRENPNLPKGEEREVQAGVNGEATRTFEVTLVNGDEASRKEVGYEVTKDPVDRIIEVGEQVTETKTETKTELVEFDTVYRGNPNLPKGEEREVQAGVDGTRTIKYEVTLVNGEVTSRKEVSSSVTKAPVNRIVEVGEQVTETKTETKTELVEFKTEYRKNPNLAKGEEKEVQKGVNGEATRTFEVTLVNGDEASRKEVGYEVTKDPVNRIIEVGAPVNETKTETKTESVGFDTEHRPNPNLAQGEEREVQAGKNGVRTIKYEVTYVNGEESSRKEVSSSVTTQPVNRIVEVGTQVTETKTETKTELVEFETVYRPNPNLPKGEEKLVQAGVDGTRTIKYEVTYVNDKVTSRKEVSNTVTKAPVNRIVEVGTKENQVSDDLIIEYKKGDKIGEYTLTKEVSFNVSDIVNADDAYKHKQAQTGGNLHTTSGQDESGQNWRIGIRMSEEVVDAFNDGTIFNHSIFNDHMLKLVNDLRQSVGKHTLEHAEVDLQGAADIRAQEMADYGSLRFENQPHTRPDGTKWHTVLPEDRNYGAGENIAGRSHHTNFYETLSETALAEAFFNQWKASDGHYANMIGTGYTGFATAVRIGTGVTPAQGDSVFNNLIAVQILKGR